EDGIRDVHVTGVQTCALPILTPYLYLSLLPEALVASHLAPEEYGAYLATGAQKRARGQAVFFKLTDAFAAAHLARLGVEPHLGPIGRASCRGSAEHPGVAAPS